MKGAFFKATAVFLSLMIMLGMLAACGVPEDITPTDNTAGSSENTLSDTLAAPNAVTIEADGRIITFEDASGKSIAQLLDQAGITLDEGDILSLIPDQAGPGKITLQVLRQHSVSVVVAAKEDPTHSRKHALVVMEGTVADAIAAAGVELAENHAVNYSLNTPLEDGMEILVSGDTFAQFPAVTDPTDPSSGSDDPTEPTPGQSEKTIISIEIYEDCDGSGHGIKVITYSDGTQEEVLF